MKFRKDMSGVVFLDGAAFKAGDEIPEGAQVGGHLTSTGKDYGFPDPVVDVVPVVEVVEPLTEDETARATELGIPTDVHPERVRGALEGYAQAQADALDAEIEAERVAAEALSAEAAAAAAVVPVDPKLTKSGKA